jgi:hypothetical protein
VKSKPKCSSNAAEIADFFKTFDQWQEWTQSSETERYVIYGGSNDQNWPQAIVLGWKSAGKLIKKLEKVD